MASSERLAHTTSNVLAEPSLAKLPPDKITNRVLQFVDWLAVDEAVSLELVCPSRAESALSAPHAPPGKVGAQV
jgi:hypothetical protein